MGTSLAALPSVYPMRMFDAAPDRPINVAAESSSWTELMVTWDYPVGTVAGDITRFEVQYDTVSTFQSGDGRLLSPPIMSIVDM